MNELSASEIREKISGICDAFIKRPLQSDVVKVTRYGKAAVAMIPWEMYISILETMEILEDPAFMKRLKSSMKQMKKGQGKSWVDFKKERGLAV